MAIPSITVQPAAGAVAIFDAIGYKHARQDEQSTAKMMKHLEYLTNQGTNGLYALDRLLEANPHIIEMRGVFNLRVPLDGSLKLRLARFSDTFQIAAWHAVDRPDLAVCLQAVLGGLVTIVLFSVTEDPHVLFRGAIEVGPLMIGAQQVDGSAYRGAVAEFESQSAGVVHLCAQADRIVSEQGLHKSGGFPCPLFRTSVPFKNGDRDAYIVNPVGCASQDARTDFVTKLVNAFHIPAGQTPTERIKILMENSERLYRDCESGTPLPALEG